MCFFRKPVAICREHSIIPAVNFEGVGFVKPPNIEIDGGWSARWLKMQEGKHGEKEGEKTE
jgi:hypothetical protein